RQAGAYPHLDQPAERVAQLGLDLLDALSERLAVELLGEHVVAERLDATAEVDPPGEAPLALGEGGLPGDLEVLEGPVLGCDLSEHLRRLIGGAELVPDPHPREPVGLLSGPVDHPTGLD